MKTIKRYLLLLAFAGLLTTNFACSSDSSPTEKKNEDEDNEGKALSLTTSKRLIILNETLNFIPKLDNDLATHAQIFINDELIQGTSFKFTELGEYKVKAKLANGEESAILKITVFENEVALDKSISFEHRVLIEDFTGAWCQYCPLVAYDIEQLEQNHGEKIQAIAIHNSQSNNANNGGHDPFDFFPKERRAFENEMKVNGYPFATINRKDNFRTNPNRVLTLHQPKSRIGIKISSEVYTNDALIKVSIKFGEDYNADLKYAVFLLEDHLLFRQANSTQYYSNLPKTGGFSENFEHNNTLVGMGTGFRGEMISASQTIKGNEFSNENIYLLHKAKNINNTKIVVVVTNNAGEALNVISAPSNTTQDYQLVN